MLLPDFEIEKVIKYKGIIIKSRFFKTEIMMLYNKIEDSKYIDEEDTTASRISIDFKKNA